MPLKIAVYDLSGALLEQVVFTEQHVREVLPFTKTKPADGNQHGQSITESTPGVLPFSVTNLPAGFKEIYFARRAMHDSRLPVDHLLMSDGLASVSVYMENRNLEIESGFRSVGAVNFYSRDFNDYQVTVMGEVPPLTVKVIAEGIGLESSRH